MKSLSKKIILVLFILILLFSINTKVYALDQIAKDAEDFLADGKQNKPAQVNEGALQDASRYLYNILLSAGVVIAVVVATVLGIQFMISGTEGQAKVKEMLIPFVVGCVIVFGGFGIWNLVLNIGNKATGESSGWTGTSKERWTAQNHILQKLELTEEVKGKQRLTT